MSLPTYDDISDAKASVETVKGLSVEPDDSFAVGIATKAKTEAKAAAKAKAKAKEEKQAEMKRKTDALKAEFAEKKEKEVAKRQAEKEAKLEVVDTGLPSYSESTTFKGKNVFAL
jgi:flavin-dependent dehydrogenase